MFLEDSGDLTLPRNVKIAKKRTSRRPRKLLFTPRSDLSARALPVVLVWGWGAYALVFRTMFPTFIFLLRLWT